MPYVIYTLCLNFPAIKFWSIFAIFFSRKNLHINKFRKEEFLHSPVHFAFETQRHERVIIEIVKIGQFHSHKKHSHPAKRKKKNAQRATKTFVRGTGLGGHREQLHYFKWMLSLVNEWSRVVRKSCSCVGRSAIKIPAASLLLTLDSLPFHFPTTFLHVAACTHTTFALPGERQVERQIGVDEYTLAREMEYTCSHVLYFYPWQTVCFCACGGEINKIEIEMKWHR